MTPIFWSTLSAIILLAFFVFVLILPIPVKAILRMYVYQHVYDPTPDVARVSKNELYILYSKPGNRKLCVIFIGGAFMFNNLRTHTGFANELFARISNTHDVLLLSYRTRFVYTVHDGMLSINDTLSEFLDYEDYCAIGMSAGALYAGAFVRKEADANEASKMKVGRIGLEFTRFVGVCGVYETSFDNAILDALFAFYIMRHTPNARSYTCHGLNIPMLLVSHVSDPLFSQTLRLMQTQETERLILREKLPHSFAQMINLQTTLTSLDTIATFIRKPKQ